MNTDAPLFVTGMPRSGTTLLQQLLSQHPRIAIHGQEPRSVHWATWLHTLLAGLRFAERSNADLNYSVPHYAGGLNADSTRREFLAFLKHYLIGNEAKPRWGVKSLHDCRQAADGLAEVWPGSRWIVCLRDPFRTIESLRNTFDRDQRLTLPEAVAYWVDVARFAVTRSGAIPVYVDRLSDPVCRQAWLGDLFAFIGEEISPEVKAFVDSWPRIHQVVPDDQRTYRLSMSERDDLLIQFPELAEWRTRLGFEEIEGAT